MKSAVLFLVFNRPEKTAQVFASIRLARPARLYVSADGPRPGRQGEAERCAAVREIASAVDWPCELKTLFRSENLGCKLGVSSGIDWFFTHEDEGIILEDDVLPDSSFYPYCDELLERYRSDERIAAISGCNLISDKFASEDSYFFSRYCHVWGWATWRRSWMHYDVSVSDWPAWREQLASQAFSNDAVRRVWVNIFDETHAGKIDTWDFQWILSYWRRNALCILPAFNLTDNLGFDADATHTTGQTPAYVTAAKRQKLGFPLGHPVRVERCVAADMLIDRTLFAGSRIDGLMGPILRARNSVLSSLRKLTRQRVPRA